MWTEQWWTHRPLEEQEKVLISWVEFELSEGNSVKHDEGDKRVSCDDVIPPTNSILGLEYFLVIFRIIDFS